MTALWPASVDAQIETNKNTALTFACIQNHFQIAELLIAKGANIEHRSKSGLTPLMEAAANSNFEVARVLMEYGADINAISMTNLKDSALTIAAAQDNGLKIVQCLVNEGANVDYKQKKGATALLIASSNGLLSVVKFLVSETKCDVHTKDHRGVSPIFSAFKGGHLSVVEFLSQIVLQFPREEEIVHYLSSFKLSKEKNVEQDAKYFEKLLNNMEESIKILFKAKEKRSMHSSNAMSVLLKTLEGNCILLLFIFFQFLIH